MHLPALNYMRSSPDQNLFDLGNNVIGEIGEVIACKILPYAHRTKGKTKNFLDQEFSFIIPEYCKQFLKSHWNSIDLFRFTKDPFRCELIDVKTKSKTYSHPKDKRFHLTPNTLNIYKEALSLGIFVKIMNIYLKKEWKFFYKIDDLMLNNITISKGGRNTSYWKKRKLDL